MTTLFISDLHLDSRRPEVTRAFLNFLTEQAANAESLYILGDLFEAWVGDDGADEHDKQVMTALGALTAGGVPCYLLRGNRDFLLGADFEKRTGVRILPEPIPVQLYGTTVLIEHGDVLCSDDKSYQRFRSIVRNRLVQAVFLALPLALRRRIALRLRAGSMAGSRLLPKDILDVNQGSVEARLRDHDLINLLHGHTHRPAIHCFSLDGQSARRIVLGDWYDQGSVLSWGSSGPSLKTLSLHNP